MEILISLLRTPRFRVAAVVTACLLGLLIVFAPQPLKADNERVITVFHDGIEQTVVTDAPNVGELLKRMDVAVHKYDSVEPALDTEFAAPSYNINVYRARPVTVVDGAKRYQIMSAHTSARKIAETAGLTVRNEDAYNLERIDNFLGEDGVGLKLSVERAIPINFTLFGKTSQIYTTSDSVNELLKSKNIHLATTDKVWPDVDTQLSPNMGVVVYRDGKVDITEEPVPFEIEKIFSNELKIGERKVQQPGVNGKRFVIYGLEDKDGKTVRKEIQSYIMTPATKQIEVVGMKRNGFAGSFEEALGRLRSCEGKYTSISRNGLYYGAYQFNLNTWRAYAPNGYKDVLPSNAPPSVQDQAAHNLYQKRGWQPWPTCSVKLGLQDVYR